MTDSISARMASATGAMSALVKDTEGYNYEYVSLNQVLDVVRPALRDQGLEVLQPVDVGPTTGRAAVYTVMVDVESGETHRACEYPLPDGVSPQDMGSAITYARRYSLVALFSLPIYDDDAAAAQASATRPPVDHMEQYDDDAAAAQVSATAPPADPRADQLNNMLASLDDDFRDGLRSGLKVRFGRWSELDDDQKDEAVGWVQDKIARREFPGAEEA